VVISKTIFYPPSNNYKVSPRGFPFINLSFIKEHRRKPRCICRLQIIQSLASFKIEVCTTSGFHALAKGHAMKTPLGHGGVFYKLTFDNVSRSFEKISSDVKNNLLFLRRIITKCPRGVFRLLISLL